ncbi:hypothetical protein CHUUTOTORO_01470 [Serratia phage vB_SmaM-ChuuTotoro]|nr:hypothetical protein CHUUTOTORO_01470 [Serratia phage vB_SmaM-ChuuTotoro]
MYTYKDLKKGAWFSCVDWYKKRPLLKVSNATFYDPRDMEFVKFSESIFTQMIGGVNEPAPNVCTVDENQWLINGTEVKRR